MQLELHAILLHLCAMLWESKTKAERNDMLCYDFWTQKPLNTEKFQTFESIKAMKF